MKTKFSNSLVYSIISFVIITSFVIYIYENADKYKQLLKISPSGVLTLCLISLAFPVINGIQNTFLYRGLGLNDFSYWDGFLITSASTLANQLPVPGGIISKGYYLKRNHNLSYTKFSSSTLATFFCFLAINSMIGILTLIYWKINDGIYPPFILLISFISMIAPILFFWFPLDRIKLPEKIMLWSNQAIDGWMTIGRNPGLLIRLIVTQVLLVVLLAFRYLITFRMLSQNITLSHTLLFASASILTQLVSIAPGGLGVREAIVASIATVLGFDAGTSVVAVGLDRLMMTMIIFITGFYSTFLLRKQITDPTP